MGVFTTLTQVIGLIKKFGPQTILPTKSPSNNSIMGLGDSRIDRQVKLSGTTWSYESEGFINVMSALLGAPFYYDENYIFGVSGGNSEDIYNITADALAACDAGTVIYLCSTNEANQPISFTVEWASKTFALIQAAGRQLIIVNELPKGDTASPGNGMTASQARVHQQRRQWYARQAQTLNGEGRPNVRVFDPWPYLVDRQEQKGYFLVGKTSDGVHPVVEGGTNIADAGLDMVSAMFPSKYLLCEDNRDVYNATDNPYGNIFSNGAVVYTTGGTPGTGGSGSIADGFVGANNSGAGTATRTYSMVTSDGLPWNLCVLAGTTSTGTPTVTLWRASGLLASMTAGQKYEMFAALKFSGLSEVFGIRLRGRFTGAATNDWIYFDGYTEDFPIPSTLFDRHLVYRCSNIYLDSFTGVTDFVVELVAQLSASSAIAGDVYLRSFGLRKQMLGLDP